tara:strand:- start:88 stop:381 length:294 start_codon:yes stop_codon:yes gene_type:complete
MRATTPGEAFLAAIAPILDAAGPLPHARLDTGGESTAPKKQKARMLKCECATCGYTVRTARKWLELAGAPLCPIEDHGQMQHESLDDDEDGDEDEGG